MTEDRSRRDASSTSHPRPSRPFPRSGTASSTSRSAGRAPGLGAAELRALADRHGIVPRRLLGQHFLLDLNVARAIVRDAAIGPGDRVVEIGAGLGSLTLALDASGADVVAVELDPALVSALNDVLEGRPRVRVVPADAMRLDWDTVLGPGDDPWILCANLPYNIATPLVLDVLARVPRVVRSVVMMQREVGERLAARPGDD
ncbi:MAG: 16S rRNA (adenine(1518)-N(6)/adenine(1519)-N(6))-dimethyltransferase, partial [Actinobacteria bacterium]